MNPRIKLRHLSSFVEVARCGGVTHAARALFVPQSAVSRSLTELEDILGAPLLQRGGRGVLLTPFGKLFLRHAEHGLAVIRQGEKAVTAARAGGIPQIALGSLQYITAGVVPRAVCEFMRENPELVVRVTTGINAVLLSMLKSGELEFVIGRMARVKEMEGVNFEHLYSERLALVVRPGHPLLRKWRGKIPGARQVLEDAGSHVFVSVPPKTSVRDDIKHFFIQAGAALPPRRVETDSVAMARGMVLSEGAVWCAPLEIVDGDLRAGAMREFPVDMSGTYRSVGISVRAESLVSPQCAALMEKIRATARSMHGGKM